VVTLATGQVREWQWPHASWTPLVQGQGSWTADGRTLALQQWYVGRGSAKAPANDAPAGTTLVRLVDTTAPAGTATPGKLLTLRAPAGHSSPWGPFLTPDGSELVATTGTGAWAGLPGKSAGELAVYSAQTGALIRTVAPWTWTGSRRSPGNPFPTPAVAWSDASGSRLLVIQPHGGANRLGVLTGGQVVLTGNDLLPGRPEAYASLQAALPYAASVPPHMTW
jgi:hypothetical protein